MSLEFAKAGFDRFDAVCALYQQVIGAMKAQGLRQWEWDVYPTRELLEEDVRRG